jgi:ABC-2 type transport system ATP-binding protein
MNQRDLAISCRGLTKRYGNLTAVDSIDLAVRRGEIVGFLGPNGAGKSTTIRMLLGLARPDGGEGSLLGERLPASVHTLARVGAMIEQPAFYPWMSGRRNLEVLLAGSDGAGADIARALDSVGLSDVGKRKVRTYSHGMRQRLGLALAICGSPEVAILDEPANGLDPAGVHEFRGICRDLADAGTAVFLSSHLLSDIEKSCDRVVILKGGRIIADGTLAELGADDPWIHVKVDPADAFRAAALLADLSPREQGPGEFLVRAQSGKLVGKLLLDGGIVPEGIGQKGPTLEELFLALTEGRR